MRDNIVYVIHLFIELIQNFQYWYWWVLAGSLIFLEIITGTTFFFWLALAAGGVGLAAWLIPTLSLEFEFMVFAASFIVSGVLTKIYYATRTWQPKEVDLDELGHKHIGEEHILMRPIINGKSKITFEDVSWTIRGPDAPIGTKIRIVDVHDDELVVEFVL